MDRLHDTPPTAVDTPPASSELIKLVRKLRWIGLEEEARHVEEQLAHRRPSSTDTVLSTPSDTD
jgi:hypothetical protein